jgi:putative SOS response-associated peptidase YedK
MAMTSVPAEVESRRCEGKIGWFDNDFQFHIKPFHNRCPLIIEPKDYERWLAPAGLSHLPIDLVRTFPAEGMKAWRVAKLQGNGPHLLEPLVESGESA